MVGLLGCAAPAFAPYMEIGTMDEKNPVVPEQEAHPEPPVPEPAIELITRHEALRLKAYKDPGGVMTIGYGHTRSPILPTTITEEEASKLLFDDLEYFAQGVEDLVEVPLNENQYSALVSLAFNVGLRSFATSKLLRKLNRGDYLEASKEFLRGWDTSKGKRLTGLVRRRAQEQQLFLTPARARLVEITSVPFQQGLVELLTAAKDPAARQYYDDATISIAKPLSATFVPEGWSPPGNNEAAPVVTEEVSD